MKKQESAAGEIASAAAHKKWHLSEKQNKKKNTRYFRN